MKKSEFKNIIDEGLKYNCSFMSVVMEARNQK